MNLRWDFAGEGERHGRLAGASSAFKKERLAKRVGGDFLQYELWFGEPDEVRDLLGAVLLAER
jgi:hypothetical protein